MSSYQNSKRKSKTAERKPQTSEVTAQTSELKPNTSAELMPKASAQVKVKTSAEGKPKIEYFRRAEAQKAFRPRPCIYFTFCFTCRFAFVDCLLLCDFLCFSLLRGTQKSAPGRSKIDPRGLENEPGGFRGALGR